MARTNQVGTLPAEWVLRCDPDPFGGPQSGYCATAYWSLARVASPDYRESYHGTHCDDKGVTFRVTTVGCHRC